MVLWTSQGASHYIAECERPLTQATASGTHASRAPSFVERPLPIQVYVYCSVFVTMGKL